VANDPLADVWLPGVPRIADLRRDRGPLGGVHAALAQGANDILVVAWDMPFVAPPLLTELRRRGRDGHAVVVPESADGCLEPACALYTPACRGDLAAWLDSGRSGASAFLGQCPGVHRLSVAEVTTFGDPRRLFFSVNTPAALEQAELLATAS
jgi:molybdopterin-guanine dinucleotide biosynthesis protein A